MTLSDLGPGYHLVPTSAHAGVRRHGRCSWGADGRVNTMHRAFDLVDARHCDPMAVQAAIILRAVLRDFYAGDAQ